MLRIALLICVAIATPVNDAPCPRRVCIPTAPEFHASVTRWVGNVGPNGHPDSLIRYLLNCGLVGEPISFFELAILVSNTIPTVFNTTIDALEPGYSFRAHGDITSEMMTNTLDLAMTYVKYQEIRHVLQDEALARMHRNETALNLQLNATENATRP